jgi:hypothetical protein
MSVKGFPSRAERPAPPPPFEIRQTFWGYVVRGTDGPPMLLQVAQGTVLGFGAAFTAAALVLVMGEGVEGDQAMRRGFAVVLSSLALLLMWFATRGGVVELQFDLARGELRELLRHRAGRATVLGRHGLDAGAALTIERAGPTCRLLLRLRDDGEALCVAQGPEAALLELRRRLDGELRSAAFAAAQRRGLAA